MEIQRYLLILKSRKWVVILTATVTLAVAALGSFWMTPVYSASALVRVAEGHSDAVNYNDLNYTERLMQTYVHLLKSRPFLEEVIGRLSLRTRPEDLASIIKVEVLADTELIKIGVEGTDPREAMAIANTLGDLLVEQGQKVYSGQGKSAREILQEQLTVLEGQLREDRALLANLSSLQPDPDQPQDRAQDLTTKIRSEEETYAMLLSQYDKARVDEAMRANSISIAEPAIVPGAPSKPNIKLNLALGALVGLMGGMGLALLFENLNPAIYSMDDLEATAGASLLGRIPSFKIRKGIRQETILFKNSAAQSLAGEAFRALSTNTLALTSGTRLKTVLVSSAEPRAGKSTVLANLAAAMAQAGRRVVVVDGDLRNPCVHEIFGLAREPGLCDAILNPNRLGTVVQETEVKGVRALTAGSSPPHPAEVLNAPSLLEVIQKLTEEADIVLWDSPPVLTAADAAVLAPTVDGVVLVVECAQTRREDVQTACQQLAAVKANLIGIVVNRAEQGGSHYYYHRTPNEGG